MTGAGSTWESNSSIYVGLSGFGTPNIEAGGESGHRHSSFRFSAFTKASS
ncbi:hypothetical protein FDR95_00815 [Rhizobiaceae bacterium LC148]|nr:hypothetical protein FDR95_00815 [Rhizobiaceae bacterium LC148]